MFAYGYGLRDSKQPSSRGHRVPDKAQHRAELNRCKTGIFFLAYHTLVALEINRRHRSPTTRRHCRGKRRQGIARVAQGPHIAPRHSSRTFGNCCRAKSGAGAQASLAYKPRRHPLANTALYTRCAVLGVDTARYLGYDTSGPRHRTGPGSRIRAPRASRYAKSPEDYTPGIIPVHTVPRPRCLPGPTRAKTDDDESALPVVPYPRPPGRRG